MVAWLSIRHKGSSCSSAAERAREGGATACPEGWPSQTDCRWMILRLQFKLSMSVSNASLSNCLSVCDFLLKSWQCIAPGRTPAGLRNYAPSKCAQNKEQVEEEEEDGAALLCWWSCGSKWPRPIPRRDTARDCATGRRPLFSTLSAYPLHVHERVCLTYRLKVQKHRCLLSKTLIFYMKKSQQNAMFLHLLIISTNLLNS